MTRQSIEVVAREQLTEADLKELRRLFDSEYREEFGFGINQQSHYELDRAEDHTGDQIAAITPWGAA